MYTRYLILSHSEFFMRIILLLALSVVASSCDAQVMQAERCYAIGVDGDQRPGVAKYLDKFAEQYGFTIDKTNPSLYFYVNSQRQTAISLSPYMGEFGAVTSIYSKREVCELCLLFESLAEEEISQHHRVTTCQSIEGFSVPELRGFRFTNQSQ